MKVHIKRDCLTRIRVGTAIYIYQSQALFFKGTVSRKLRHRLIYIIQKLFFIFLTHAIKSNFFARIFAQFTFKSNGALSTIPLKFSVNFEEFSWRRTFPLKIFCVHLRLAPFFLTYSLQSICLVNFSLFMLSHFL